jgi:hypothetical protein
VDNEPRRNGAEQSEPAYGIRTTDAGAGLFPTAPGVSSGASGAYEAVPAGTSVSTRVLGYLLAFVLGGLFGVLGTVVHQISVSVFGLFDLPVGLVIALAAEALLLVGLRLVAPSRLAPILAAVGLIGIVALLALPSPGGSVLIPESVAGMVWLIGSTLVAVLVVAWPRLGGARSATK